MSGWKKYGGTNKLELTNNLTVNSIVTDNLSLKKYYLGDWDICGGLRVKDNATIYRDTDLCGNLIVGKDTTLLGEFSVAKDTNLYGNLVVLNDAYFSQNLYFDPLGNTLLHAINGGFGFNKYNPLATIDISSDRIQTVGMKTSTIENRNIYAQNVNSQGVVVGVDSGNTYINMFVDRAMNSSGEGAFDGQLRYATGGHFYIDVSNVMNVRPRVVFGNDLSKPMNSDLDRVVIYDTEYVSQNAYLKDVYMDDSFKTGMPLALISKDSSSNVFMRMTNSDGNGFAVGGGYFEGDMMGSLVFTNNGGKSYPAMNIFSGDLDKYLKTSIGINKHRVSKGESNRYALDINGPTKIIHQELLVGADISMQIFAMEFSNDDVKIGYAVGSPFNAVLSLATPTYERYFLKTTDGGYTWTRSRILLASTGLPDPNLESASSAFFAINVFSDNFVVIGGQGGFLYYTVNGGVRWTQVQYNATPTFNITSAISNLSGSNTLLVLNTGEFIDTGAFADVNNILTVRINSALPPNNKYVSGLTNILNVDSYNNFSYMIGVGGIQGYTLGSGGVINPSARFFTDSTFLDVSIFYGADGKYHTVAVGASGLLKYVHASSITDAWSSPVTSIVGNLNSVHVLSETHAIAVGDNGLVIFSDDGFVSWKTISHTELNAMGNGDVIDNLSLSNIYAVDSLSEFVIVGDVQSYVGGSQRGRMKILNLYAPYFFNRANNFVLEASGSILLSGDLRINDFGNVFTNSNSISLFPDVATEVNIGNTVIGGYTNVKHNLNVIGNAHIYQKLIVDSYSFLNDDVSLNGRLYVTKDASLNSNLFVGRDVSLGSKLYVVGDASLNSRAFVGGDVSFGSKFYVAGDVSMSSRLFVGGDVSFGANLYVVRDASLNSRLFVGGDVSFGAKLRVAGKSAFESDVSINANLFVIDVSARHLDLRGTRNSDGVGSGALIVQGGASIGNDLNVGGNLYINNYLDSVSGADHLHLGYTNTQKMYIGSSDFTNEIRVGTSISGVRSSDIDIYIGDDAHSRVHILGNLLVPGQVTFQNQTNLEIQNKNILLNDQAPPGTSFGAGIYIREDNSDQAGQILINPNMSGFFLKATRSTNIVNFETELMKLPAGLGRGILTIVPTSTSDGSNYTVARGVVDISDIQFLDASLNNRVMRNPVTTLTQVNTQVINGNLLMTGLYVNKLEATVVGNAQVDISGNAIVSRMGLGASIVRPSYVLDISGNTFSNGAILQW